MRGAGPESVDRKTTIAGENRGPYQRNDRENESESGAEPLFPIENGYQA